MPGELEEVEFLGFPKRTNCLAWSDDGDLAVAVTDQVFVLVQCMLVVAYAPSDWNQTPKRDNSVSGDGPGDRSQWHRSRFSAGSFSQAEWPEIEKGNMATVRRSFIGREQAIVEIVALAWSPPGLAQRFRCALAVLTTNGALSIWARDSEGSLASKWKRFSVVNQSLGDDWHGILAMAWSPVVDSQKSQHDAEAPHPSRAPLNWRYYLAINLDDHTLRILCASRVFCKNHTFALSLSTSFKSSPYNIELSKHRFRPCRTAWINSQAPLMGTSLNGLEWDQWVYPESTDSATCQLFMRIFNEEKNFEVMVDTDGHLTVLEKQRNPSANEDLRCNDQREMKIWSAPYSESSARSIIFVLHSNRMMAVATTLKHNQGEPSDTAYICLASREYSLEYYRKAPQRHPEASSNSWIQCIGRSHLNEQIKIHTQEFSEKNKLAAVDTRVWGLASYGSHIAICVTFHPAHLIQYTTHSQAICHVLFSHSNLEPGAEQRQTASIGLSTSFPWMNESIGESYKSRILPRDLVFPALLAKGDLTPDRMNYQLCFALLVSSLLMQETNATFNTHKEAVFNHFSKSKQELPIFRDLRKRLRNQSGSNSKGISPATLIETINQYIEERSLSESSAEASARYLEYCPLAGCGKQVFWSSSLGACCGDGHRQSM